MVERPIRPATLPFRLLLVATVSLAAACGGDDGGTPAPSSDVVAFAVGGLRVSRSDDQGASWREVFNAGVGHALGGVDFVDRATGWVVGTRAIYRTTTAGRDWEDQSANIEGDPVALLDVAFLDAARGVVGGYGVGPNGGTGAVALVTSDGGAHWRRRVVGRPQTWVRRLSLSPEGVGVAVGAGIFRAAATFVLTTDDGGESWTDVTAVVREAAGEPIILANCEQLSPHRTCGSWASGRCSWSRRTAVRRGPDGQ